MGEKVLVDMQGSLRTTTHEYHPDTLNDERIIRGFLSNLKRVKSNPKPRWERVMNATGNGSTVAWQICVRFGFDPEEKM